MGLLPSVLLSPTPSSGFPGSAHDLSQSPFMFQHGFSTPLRRDDKQNETGQRPADPEDEPRNPFRERIGLGQVIGGGIGRPRDGWGERVEAMNPLQVVRPHLSAIR